MADIQEIIDVLYLYHNDDPAYENNLKKLEQAISQNKDTEIKLKENTIHSCKRISQDGIRFI